MALLETPTRPRRRAAGRRPALEWVARIGYAARGVVYLLVAWFALAAAFGGGGEVRGSQGALSSLVGQTWGLVLLGLIAAGLVGHAVWRVLQGLLDVDGHGSQAKGLAIRAGLLGSALVHLGLAAFAGWLLFGFGSGNLGGGGGRERGTSWLLGLPGGQWIVGLIGVAILGVAVGQAWKAYTAKFRERMSLERGRERWVVPIGRLGLVARAVVFGIVGVFFLQAAIRYDPAQTGGLADALRSVRDVPLGSVLFPLVAIGLLCFALYSFTLAAYRRIPAPRLARAR